MSDDLAACGLLLVNKPKGKNSFALVSALRRLSGIRTIGHAGTLDPFATGVMLLLIGKPYTRLSEKLIQHDKEYIATLLLGMSTDTYDCDGAVQEKSNKIPTLEEIEEALKHFQGDVLQTPPMFSAKKVGGKKLYELARKGKTIERAQVPVFIKTTLLSYSYPYLHIQVHCSKGTYIRSIAHDLGAMLGCYAHLSDLTRIRSGCYLLENCIDGNLLFGKEYDYRWALRSSL